MKPKRSVPKRVDKNNPTKDHHMKKKIDDIYERIQEDYQLRKYRLGEAISNTQKQIEKVYRETLARATKIKLRVFRHEGFWKTMNTHKDVTQFEEADLPEVLK